MKHDLLADGALDAAAAAGHGRFDEAVRLLTDISTRRALTSPELVLLGRSIQLSANGRLDQARSAFENAIAADESNVAALLELGWFIYFVENDAPAAQPLFERALDKTRESLRESIEGLIRCVAEGKGDVAAKEILSEVTEGLVNQQDILTKTKIET